MVPRNASRSDFGIAPRSLTFSVGCLNDPPLEHRFETLAHGRNRVQRNKPLQRSWWGDPTIVENLFCPPSSRSMFPGTFASQGHCQIVLLAAILVDC